MIISKLLTSIVLALFSGGSPSELPSQQIEEIHVPPAIVQEITPEIKEDTQEIQEDIIETKQESEKEEISFQSKRENDSFLLKGETKIKQEGRDGIREKIYTVTYTNGNETNRELTSNTVVQEPVDEITSVGIKSPVVTAPKTTGKGYINVDGDFVKSPGSDPAGASAKCRDGSYSYSKNRRGTCSGHGGVASWL